MKNPVIQFQNVSKHYVKQRLRYGMLSEALPQLFASPRDGSTPDGNIIQALDEVNFDINRGEAVGIIGPNGAGKSTILKLISQVTVPDSGKVAASGRIGALIELGAGLHPELTGRENIFLYGAILGMKRKEVESKFDEIVEFSEINSFLDMPIKRYSSGMYARLGFSVAVNMEPDILLIDEVLAVGDEKFQKKCFAKMNLIKNNETTIVFVSHNLEWISSLCTRAIWLERGTVQKDGSPKQVISSYHARI